MTDLVLCAAPRCRIPGRHADHCDQDDCRGCQRAHAADGIRLCLVDLRRLGANATKAATLHSELELVLKATGSGDRSSSKPGPGTPPRDAVVDMRAEIRHVLASWCRLIGEERGFGLPHDSPQAMGKFIAHNSEWLAADEDYAGYAADELAALASRAWGLAYPSGTRRVEVGPCPLCDGALTALVRATDAQLPSEVACDGDDTHRWPAERWRELDRLVSRKKVAA